MKNTVSVKVNVGDKELTIETGLLAKQAAGSCTVRMGDTVLFSAATCAREPREGVDYFPLQVEYREKFYAAGRFPGGFFKREGRPTEKEVLTARLTDRPIRPLFPKYFRNEVQVNNMLLSSDGQNDPDTMSIVAASTSLTLSDIPFQGPIAGVRVGRVDGAFVVNPTHAERDRSDLDLICACTRDLPLMIEGSADEIAEADMVAAMKFAQAACVKLIDAQVELRRLAGRGEKNVEEPERDDTLLSRARELAGEQLREALLVAGKLERQDRVAEIIKSLRERLTEQNPDVTGEQLNQTAEALEIEVVRKNVLDHGKRIDGRGFGDLRPLYAEVGMLPRTHGSAIFSRGETQALGTVTLGTKSDTQSLDAITGGLEEKKFMLHYNFPPYSVGEVGRLGSSSRREIGHGLLAERAFGAVLPKDYPYTIRMVSDIMESNGSSSMASVCVATLAMMDAGIPLTRPVAGISIGLFTGPDKAELVTDIIGAEDHCGDMDFKVAGTREGITAFQTDLKIRGLEWNLVERAFEQARLARMQILDFMQGVIAEPRPELSQHAPRLQEIKIPREKIGDLIGPGGKIIRHITEITGAQIDVEEDGTVTIFTVDPKSMELAVSEVERATASPEVGKIYHGTVTGVKEFGAFVEILPGTDGLVHISELAGFRVNRVEDVCRLGDQMWVKCIGIDDRGKIKLSRREAMAERGETEEPPPRSSEPSPEQRDEPRSRRRPRWPGRERRPGNG